MAQRLLTGCNVFFLSFFFKEGEKHQCVVASHTPPTGDSAATQACALTGNRTDNPLVCSPCSVHSATLARSAMFSKQKNRHHAHERKAKLEPGARESSLENKTQALCLCQKGDRRQDSRVGPLLCFAGPHGQPWGRHRNLTLAVNPQWGNICPQPQKVPTACFPWAECPSFLGALGWAGESCPHTPIHSLSNIISNTCPREKYRKPPHYTTRDSFARKSRALSTSSYVCFQMLFFPLCRVWMNHILRKHGPYSVE